MKPPLKTYRILDKVNGVDECIRANHILNPNDSDVFVFYNWEMYSPEKPDPVAVICLSPGMVILDITKQAEAKEREVQKGIEIMEKEGRWLKDEN